MLIGQGVNTDDLGDGELNQNRFLNGHMVKFDGRMNTQSTINLATPPNLFRSILAGFDAVTNHIALILMPFFPGFVVMVRTQIEFESIDPVFYEAGHSFIA